MSLFEKVRNVNPIGDVVAFDPETGEKYHASAGEVIEVPPELAEKLLLQVGNWEPVTEAAAKKTEGSAK
jgi:hypothetical protein